MTDPLTLAGFILVMTVFTGLLGLLAAMAVPEFFGDDG